MKIKFFTILSILFALPCIALAHGEELMVFFYFVITSIPILFLWTLNFSYIAIQISNNSWVRKSSWLKGFLQAMALILSGALISIAYASLSSDFTTPGIITKPMVFVPFVLSVLMVALFFRYGKSLSFWRLTFYLIFLFGVTNSIFYFLFIFQ